MKSNKVLTAFLSGCLALSIILTPAASAAGEEQAATDLDLVQEVLNNLETYNLSGVDRDTLIRGAIDGMVNTLEDPYSVYFDNQEAADFGHQVDLEYVGIGVRLQYTANEVYIEEVFAASPAEKAGLKRGDSLLKINGVRIQDTAGDELSGAAGSQVTLLVQRGQVTKSFKVTRSEIASISVTSSMVGPKIAYVTISGFTQTAGTEFVAALNKMRAAGMKSMVLDLRDNPGGYMDAAVDIAEHFMDKGIMMYTADNSGTLKPVTITKGSKIGVPVVILTNANTASAAEALTGALRDNKLATVVGTTSFGKARIQSLLPISNGDMLKLTTDKYLTPNKEDFNHIGLAPDIKVEGSAAQLITAMQIAGMSSIEATGDNHIMSLNGIPFAGNLGLVRKGNLTYASSRVLTALVEGEVTWDAKNKKVIVTNGAGATSGFSLASKDALYQNQGSYIELSAFSKKFPQLTWSYNAAQNLLKLAVK
ncbi:S41 family peptidase [Paenibacillus donghaensis]|nr:S41 family peptidase [Paenibacillus donghaensis]